MKFFMIVAIAFAAQASFAGEKKSEINPYGKHFEGSGVEADMVLFSEKNSDGLQDALIRFKGAAAHDAGIDGQVMKYEAQHGGTGVNFNYKKGKEEKTRMITRNSWGDWSNFEVFLDGKTFKVYLDEKKSKDVKSAELLSSYQSAKK